MERILPYSHQKKTTLLTPGLRISRLQNSRSNTSVTSATQFVVGFPGSLAGKEYACSAGDPSLSPGVKICWRRDRLPTPVFLGFPGVSAGKESICGTMAQLTKKYQFVALLLKPS